MKQSKWVWIEDVTEELHLNVEVRVRVYFHISRDRGGKPTEISFSHLRFKAGTKPNGHAEYGPRLGPKDVGGDVVKNLEAQVKRMADRGDLDEEGAS